jgi:hypothetical protein
MLFVICIIIICMSGAQGADCVFSQSVGTRIGHAWCALRLRLECGGVGPTSLWRCATTVWTPIYSSWFPGQNYLLPDVESSLALRRSRCMTKKCSGWLHPPLCFGSEGGRQTHWHQRITKTDLRSVMRPCGARYQTVWGRAALRSAMQRE